MGTIVVHCESPAIRVGKKTLKSHREMMFIRFCTRVGLFATLMMLVFVGLARLPASPRESSFLTAIIDKHVLLESQASPRVVVVGGSNVAFGMNSADLQSRLGRPVANAGLHAGLGLKYMLADLRPYLSRGDRLVVIAEYDHFSPGSRAGSALACLLVDIDPSGWRHLSGGEKLSMAQFLAPYVCRKALYWVEVLGNRLLDRAIVESGLEIYNRNSFNRYGDVTVHWTLAPGPVQPYPKVKSLRVNRQLMKFLSDYSRDLSDSGVEMVMMPPALQAASFDNQEPWIRVVENELDRRGIGLACDPRRYRFEDRELFFDTPYHLSKAGIDLRMRLLAEDLLQR
jgi:hypothetical protein